MWSEYTINEQNVINVNNPKKTLKGKTALSQEGLSRSVHSDQMVFGTVRWEAGPCERWPKALKTKLAQGGSSCSSTQTRWFSWWPGRRLDHVNSGHRRSKRESESNSRKLRDLTKNRHSDSLKKSTYSFAGDVEEGRYWCCCSWWWWWSEYQCVMQPSDSNTVYWGIPKDSV
jgi:hypothetical protein